MFLLLYFSSRSHFEFCNGHGNSQTACHVTRWSHEEVSDKMATTIMAETRQSDGDLSDFSENSEPLEPRLDFYNSDSSLDTAGEKLRSVEAKFVSIFFLSFFPRIQQSLLTQSIICR